MRLTEIQKIRGKWITTDLLRVAHYWYPTVHGWYSACGQWKLDPLGSEGNLKCKVCERLKDDQD